MNPAIYIPIIMMFIVLFLVMREERNAVIRKLIQRKKEGSKTQMKELAEKFIGKDCIVYSFNSHQYIGVIEEVTDGALLIKKDGASEAINLDFIVRIREYPRKKNGKKKSVILD